MANTNSKLGLSKSFRLKKLLHFMLPPSLMEKEKKQEILSYSLFFHPQTERIITKILFCKAMASSLTAIDTEIKCKQIV
ncbi:CLUMA_CG008571, isoform A [Clunio marinus]|uniref:CLUMA_CG008571, isoform A n=1 Tax=Clunio marinus TaxID=568069 RepID=A0A1J1I476_9DIPT|nr:CLUMA_CG008571, isoform A [Clunio marinus]